MSTPKQQPKEHIWEAQELADHWSVSPGTIYTLLRNGKFPGAFRVGTLWRIPDKAVAAYLEEQFKVQPKTE